MNHICKKFNSTFCWSFLQNCTSKTDLQFEIEDNLIHLDMKTSQQTLHNKKKKFDTFQLSFTNPLSIRSKQDFLQYNSEVLIPSQMINLLETDDDLYNLLNESQLSFDKCQLRVSFKIVSKQKVFFIKFAKGNYDQQISYLSSLLAKTSLERDKLLRKNQKLQQDNSQQAYQIYHLRMNSMKRDQLSTDKHLKLQETIAKQKKQIFALKKANQNQVPLKVVRQMSTQILALKQQHQRNTQQLEQWHLTHCAKCGVEIQDNYGNAYGRPTCSSQCLNYVNSTLKWDKIFDFQLN